MKREKWKLAPQRKSSNKNEQGGSSTMPTCFKCKKHGHFKLAYLVYLKRILEN